MCEEGCSIYVRQTCFLRETGVCEDDCHFEVTQVSISELCGNPQNVGGSSMAASFLEPDGDCFLLSCQATLQPCSGFLPFTHRGFQGSLGLRWAGVGPPSPWLSGSAAVPLAQSRCFPAWLMLCPGECPCMGGAAVSLPALEGEPVPVGEGGDSSVTAGWGQGRGQGRG